MMAEALTVDHPEWVKLQARVLHLESGFSDMVVSTAQTKNAIIGSFDVTGTIWSPGLREQVKDLAVDFKSFKQDALSDRERGRKVGWALVSGVWTLVMGLVLEFANNYFGIWGSAHAAKIITGGH